MACHQNQCQAITENNADLLSIVSWDKQTPVKFESKYKTFHPRKCIWKYRLKHGSHFVFCIVYTEAAIQSVVMRHAWMSVNDGSLWCHGLVTSFYDWIPLHSPTLLIAPQAWQEKPIENPCKSMQIAFTDLNLASWASALGHAYYLGRSKEMGLCVKSLVWVREFTYIRCTIHVISGSCDTGYISKTHIQLKYGEISFVKKKINCWISFEMWQWYCHALCKISKWFDEREISYGYGQARFPKISI